MRRTKLCSPLGCALVALYVGMGSVTAYAESPGLEALDKRKQGTDTNQAVENRFFLKEGRFEATPLFGYVPNNPFARRYMFGGILGYHFGESLSAQAEVLYSPDGGEDDLKPLVEVLLDRAANSALITTTGGTAPQTFQQPLDKVSLSANFDVALAPFYGKINLVGETVLNFDVYVVGGLGMISKTDFIATYDENQTDGNFVNLAENGSEVKLSVTAGIGQNYFLNQFMAFKIDIRALFYVDNYPVYDPADPPPGNRLYNNIVLSAGLAFFFPKMKPRLSYDL